MDNYHSTVMGGYVNRTKIAQLYADAESLGGQTVTVAGDLPYRQVGIGNLGTCRDGSSTSVDGLHRIRIHIIR